MVSRLNGLTSSFADIVQLLLLEVVSRISQGSCLAFGMRGDGEPSTLLTEWRICGTCAGSTLGRYRRCFSSVLLPSVCSNPDMLGAELNARLSELEENTPSLRRLSDCTLLILVCPPLRHPIFCEKVCTSAEPLTSATADDCTWHRQ